VTVRARLARAWGVALLATGGACGLVIPDTVPEFSCLPGAAGACPDGQVCAAATHQCVAASGDGGVAGGEAGVGTLTGCSTLACRCAGATDCASGICGDRLTVTDPVYAAANMDNFCTKPCCTSADCDAATVCFAGAAGGNYCVRPEWLGRTARVGAGLGGGVCTGDGDCRSGLCAGSVCADVCCSTAQGASQCAAGATCQFGTFPGRSFDSRYVPHCAVAAGNGGNGAACGAADTACRSALCAIDNRCHDACRNSADCGSAAQECAYAVPNLTAGDIITGCKASPGTGAQGASCQNDQGCQSGFCDPTSMQCTDVCYADSDCEPGWRCRPELVTLLGKTYSVLACGS
jgi:hypothetical protein